MQKLIIYGAVLLAIFSLFYGGSAVVLGPGVKAAAAPIQNAIKFPAPISMKEFAITPLASYSITAKILSRKTYRMGPQSALSPFDFALGWGNMSDESFISQFEIGQSGRWYNWSIPGEPPIPMKEVSQSSANVYLIPASSAVKAVLGDMKQGQVVSLQGKLVRVDSADGWQWESSLTRDDTGSRACEVFYVESGFTVIH